MIRLGQISVKLDRNIELEMKGKNAEITCY